MKTVKTLLLLLWIVTATAGAADFFAIQSIKFLKEPGTDGVGVWTYIPLGPVRRLPDKFVPCLEVRIQTRENFSTSLMVAKMYFYNAEGKLIFTHESPSLSGTKKNEAHRKFASVFPKMKAESVYFGIPEEVRGLKWSAVAVIGDEHELKIGTFPANSNVSFLEFPEKAHLGKMALGDPTRKPTAGHLIEHVALTDNPLQPQITLFLRFPNGVTSGEQVKGVLAICMLAPTVDFLKRDLEKDELSGDYNGMLAFANKHKLAILAWGSRRIWPQDKNYDELTAKEAKEVDESFDKVAAGWERGVKFLCSTYGMPAKNFLLVGHSASAQWAKRLCLRKPEYFLAIHLNIPSSFDKPTPEAAKVLWCLSTGELESGYERSLKFWAECTHLGYPIIYKAYPGLGHSSDSRAVALGTAFLEYALTLSKERENLDGQGWGQRTSNTLPWPGAFRSPSYIGDVVDNICCRASEAKDLPKEWRTPLPTDDLARVWAAENPVDQTSPAAMNEVN